MPRRPRIATAGFAFHVMNRGARRLPLFDCPSEYDEFLRVIRDAQQRIPLRLLCYAVMPNHWHLVVWPTRDDELARFMAWLTGTHAQRWHLRRRSTGTGTIYQGRYKAIAVKDDEHFLRVCRYVERNPVKAGLVGRADEWPWSSACSTPTSLSPRLDAWPVARPTDWRACVDGLEQPGEFHALRKAIRSGAPFGPEDWRRQASARLGWTSGSRPRGRPPRR